METEVTAAKVRESVRELPREQGELSNLVRSKPVKHGVHTGCTPCRIGEHAAVLAALRIGMGDGSSGGG